MEQCSDKSLDSKLSYVENKLVNILRYPPDERSKLKNEFSRFKSDFKRRWIASHYKRNDFNRINYTWLKCKIKFTFWGKAGGRPVKTFENSSEITKRKKTLELRNTVSVEELTFATQMSQRAAGRTAVSNVIKTVGACPSTAEQLNQVILHPQTNEIGRAHV